MGSTVSDLRGLTFKGDVVTDVARDKFLNVSATREGYFFVKRLGGVWVTPELRLRRDWG